MVIPDPSLESGRAAGRLDAADESRRGKRVQRLVHRLQRHVAHAVTHPIGHRFNAKVVTGADGLKKRDADGRHPQASAAQFLGGGRRGDVVMQPNVLP